MGIEPSRTSAAAKPDFDDLVDCECKLDALRVIRAFRGYSLNETARRAQISPAYLQKLERGDVKEPSPKVLFRLSRALGFSYAKLMQHAGYVVPDAAEVAPNGGLPALAEALSSAELDPVEAEILAETLRQYREARDAGLEITTDFFKGLWREIRQVQFQRLADAAEELTLDDISSAA
jgi:transcriptional regulator with XRE-family HTH domain